MTRFGGIALLSVALTMSWSSTAQADCKDSGTTCSEADKIRDQTVREGKEQRAGWYSGRGSSNASGSSRSNEQPQCITLATVKRHCSALREAAAERWDWPDNGTKHVLSLLRGGPEPHCFTSHHSFADRVRIWVNRCQFGFSELNSLLGENPRAPKPVEKRPEPTEAEKRIAASNYVSPEERKQTKHREAFWNHYLVLLHKQPEFQSR